MDQHEAQTITEARQCGKDQAQREMSAGLPRLVGEQLYWSFVTGADRDPEAYLRFVWLRECLAAYDREWVLREAMSIFRSHQCPRHDWELDGLGSGRCRLCGETT